MGIVNLFKNGGKRIGNSNLVKAHIKVIGFEKMLGIFYLMKNIVIQTFNPQKRDWSQVRDDTFEEIQKRMNLSNDEFRGRYLASSILGYFFFLISVILFFMAIGHVLSLRLAALPVSIMFLVFVLWSLQSFYKCYQIKMREMVDFFEWIKTKKIFPSLFLPTNWGKARK